MKVMLVNGSPNKEGNTSLVLKELEKTFTKNDIEVETFWIGNKAISGCLGCGKCIGKDRCIINDVVNDFLEKADSCDGFIFAAPVHYASINGSMASFMDRVFYGKPTLFKGKVAAAVTICRRAGGVAAFDRLNKYFTYSSMAVATSNYWNGVFGLNPGDVLKDEEGMQTMRILANNMSWIMKCVKCGKDNGIEFPKMEKKIFTHYID